MIATNLGVFRPFKNYIIRGITYNVIFAEKYGQRCVTGSRFTTKEYTGTSNTKKTTGKQLVPKRSDPYASAQAVNSGQNLSTTDPSGQKFIKTDLQYLRSIESQNDPTRQPSDDIFVVFNCHDAKAFRTKFLRIGKWTMFGISATAISSLLGLVPASVAGVAALAGLSFALYHQYYTYRYVGRLVADINLRRFSIRGHTGASEVLASPSIVPFRFVSSVKLKPKFIIIRTRISWFNPATWLPWKIPRLMKLQESKSFSAEFRTSDVQNHPGLVSDFPLNAAVLGNLNPSVMNVNKAKNSQKGHEYRLNNYLLTRDGCSMNSFEEVRLADWIRMVSNLSRKEAEDMEKRGSALTFNGLKKPIN